MHHGYIIVKVYFQVTIIFVKGITLHSHAICNTNAFRMRSLLN